MKRSRRVKRLPAVPRFGTFRSSSVQASATHQAIKRTDTKAEIALRRLLGKTGRRFNVNVSDLPGCPDVVFTRVRLVVFCDGDFWHGRNWTERRRRLARGSNAEYWIAKIESNMVRDARTNRRLRRLGWRVVRIWEGDVVRSPERALRRVQAAIAKASG